MRKVLGLFAAAGLFMSLLPGAQAGPGPNGITSDNVEYVQFVPFEVGTATGANFFSKGKDDYMIITSWRSFSIYNINDPENPTLVGQPVPFGFKFENEDVATNGNIMLFSESLPQNILHVWDIEDVTNPVEIAQVPGAGDHTTTCLLDCKWAYGDSGSVTDLRNPAKPKLMSESWGAGLPPHGGQHDVTEVKPGIVLTSSSPMMLLDARKDPAKPKLLATAPLRDGPGLDTHSNAWPRLMKDRWMISQGETCCGAEQCDESTAAALTTWDTAGWQKTKTFKEVDSWTMYQGTIVDGGGIVSAPFGCSPHWFTAHPKFKNGGLLAVGWYNSGTRFLDISSSGKIEEAGWFLPNGGGTSGAYWITNEIVYAVDYQRGLDVLRYTGKV